VADFSFEVDTRRAHATITVSGDITRGDMDRFQRVVSEVCGKYEQPEVPLAITAALDSPGGDYLEGIRLGNLFWRNGYATLVRRDAECYSAAAFAFLGGAYLGTVGGWGADRTVELGASVGFHGFYSESSEAVMLRDGIERGKILSMILADYATALRIDMDFVLQSLEKGPHELLTLRTVGQFRQLGIKVRGTERTTRLTDEGAVNAANFATGWKRPVSLRPRKGETLAAVTHLRPHEYRRMVLNKLVSGRSERGPIAEMIHRALHEDGSDIDAICRDLDHLNATPNLWLGDEDRIVHVTGFDYGALFYVTDCFIKPSNEDTSSLALTVTTIHAPNYFEALHCSHSGDCLFEVCGPDVALWPE